MLIRILAIAACGAAGYLAASAFNASLTKTEPAVPEASRAVAAELRLPTAAESALVGEWEQLRAMHGGDMAAQYAAVKDTKDAFRRRAFRSALIAEWSARDPAAALAYILEKDSGNAGQFAREWLRRDPEGAITGLLAGGDKARERLRGLLNEIAKVAPRRLAEVVAALKPSGNRWDTSGADAFAIFAAKDPAAARVAAEALTGELRGQALAGVAKAWAEKDGPAALAWAQAMPPGEARDQALKAALTGWARTDPVAALGKLDLVPPGGDELHHASDTGAQVLREAAKKDWDATISWLRGNPGKLGHTSLGGLQGELSRRLGSDTAGTMRLIAGSDLPGLDHVYSNAILNAGYAHRDAIWGWLDGQPQTDIMRNLRGSMLSAIAWKEPEAALGFLERIPDTPENAPLLARGVSSLINGGSRMDQFEDLLEKAPSNLRPRMIETGFSYGAGNITTDPSRWIARLDEIPVERRAGAASRLASAWAAGDPGAAARWAESLSDASGREGALGSIAGTWAVNDPRETARWVDTLPVGGGRDAASRSLVTVLARSEPETAWTWALNIQSPESRLGSLQIAYLGLRKKDAAIAEQMLESANLPAADLQKLRDGYKPGTESQLFPR
jgi:hypothetical protein